jgi:hypothetical protein
MKKKITLIALLTVLSLSMFGQGYQQAIGVRLGVNTGVTYKKFLSQDHAIEFIGNALFDDGSTYLGVSGEYLWSWGIVDGLSWFVGPGASVGLWTGDFSGFNIALNGMVGLEYKFSLIPLAVGIDLNPHFYFLNSVGISPFVGALSVRYTF